MLISLIQMRGQEAEVKKSILLWKIKPQYVYFEAHIANRIMCMFRLVYLIFFFSQGLRSNG